MSTFPRSIVSDYLSPYVAGDRARFAREERADRAERAYQQRTARHPAIGETYFGAEVISTHTIDGICSAPTTQRMFGPREARTPRGIAADHLRRVMHFGIAADRIISTARIADMTGPAWQREESYRAAFAAERRRRFAGMMAAEEEA